MLERFSSQISGRMASGRVALIKLRSAQKITVREAGHVALLGAGVFLTLYFILAATELFAYDAMISQWSIDKSALIESLRGTLALTSIFFGIMVLAVVCEAFGRAISKRLEV